MKTMANYHLALTDLAHPKARPRFGRGRVHTERATREWEQYVGWAFIAQHGRPLLTGPVRVKLHFGGVQENQDLDNLAKAVLDALNGIAYVDDRQVHDLHITKAPAGGAETSITVEAIS